MLPTLQRIMRPLFGALFLALMVPVAAWSGTLSTPSITAPATGSTVSGTTPTLSWTSVSNADTYRVQVGTSATFDTSTDGQTCNNCVMNSKLSSTSTAASGLSAGTTYYWRVRAGNTDANSGWTESSWATGSFVTSTGTTPPPQTSGILNDTGIDFCGDASTNTANCATVAADGGTYPRQDARYGRDAQAAAGTLTKVGGGGKGFDFTKIANDGSVLPATATLGSGATDWACTRDNVTGLIWEVKTTSGLRSQSHTYTWYNSNAAINGGSVGTASGGTCATAGRCDTEKFVQDVNAAGLCGTNDWRMPTVKELEGIADLGRTNPAIDPDYFSNTPGSYFWSGSPYAGVGYSSYACYVYFGSGYANCSFRYDGHAIRLVRGGQ